MRTKDFILNCTTRQFVLLLDLVKISIDNLDQSLNLLDVDKSANSVFNDYLVLYDKLQEVFQSKF